MNPAIPASGGAGAADGIDSDDSISQSGFSGVGTPEAAAGRAGANESSKTEGAAAQFECNVCLETASEPVITRCGHLFCWPCLFRWLDTGHGTCPVCKAGVTQDNVIPLYTRGREARDPRAGGGVPGRPTAERVPAAGTGTPVNPFGAHGTFSAGIGFFPSLFGLQFQHFTGDERPPVAQEQLTPEERQSKMLAQVLYGLGGAILLALLVL